MRSTESVFGKNASEQSGDTSTAAVVDESPSESMRSSVDEVSTETTKPAEQATAKASDGADDDDDYGPVPSDVVGLTRNLGAARKGEKRWKKEARETQRQLDQLTGRLSAMQQPQGQQQNPNPDQPAPKKPGENDETYWEGPQKFVRSVVDERFGSVDQRLEAQQVQFHRTRIEDAEDAYVAQHEDGKEHIDYFKALASTNPQLKAEFAAVVERRHPQYRNPAQFAADYAKAHKQASEMQDPDAYKAKLRAEWEAERDGGQPTSDTPKNPTKPPKSIASSRGTGGAAKAQWHGPRSADSIYNRGS